MTVGEPSNEGSPSPQELFGTVPEGLQGIIINDCDDPNARARQEVRFNGLFGVKPDFVELGAEEPDLEAAGQLVDTLGALQTPEAFPSKRAVILVNVAPRGDDVREKWENGTPFCYARAGDTTVFSAFEGRALSLAARLGLVEEVELLDIPEVTGSLVERGQLTSEEAKAIQNTQFRSLEFLPLAARLLIGNVTLPSEKRRDIGRGVHNRAWLVDNFGNLKTTLLPEDIEFEEGRSVRLAPGLAGQEVVCHERLTDVPTGQFALTIGSSGYGPHRWLELVKQKGRAADDLNLSVGSKIVAGLAG
jgi:hypothetical protein